MSTMTKTGGREATTAVVPGRGLLSIGNPKTPAPNGYNWIALDSVARMESGHTPSRRKPEYWDGDIPWIGIRDATGNDGQIIRRTQQSIAQLGVDNSSTRILPVGTVCLSRTASVGYVVQMGVPMCTSQDFVNWVCGSDLNPSYLRYLLRTEAQSIRSWATGSTHKTLYFPEAKALHALLPPLDVQDRVAHVVGALDNKIAANWDTSSRIDDFLATQFELELVNSVRVRLGDVAEVNAKSMKPSSDEWIQYVDISTLGEGELLSPTRIPWSEAPGRARRALQSGDTLWSTVRPNRRSHALILGPTKGLVASTGIAVLSPRNCRASELYEATRRANFQEYLESVAEGSTYPAVRADLFSDAMIDLPQGDGRERFVVVGEALRAMQWSLRDENQRLAATRDELLPLLMSGKITVNDAEKTVEEVV